MTTYTGNYLGVYADLSMLMEALNRLESLTHFNIDGMHALLMEPQIRSRHMHKVPV